jgi:hypothetical protein
VCSKRSEICVSLGTSQILCTTISRKICDSLSITFHMLDMTLRNSKRSSYGGVTITSGVKYIPITT